MIGGIQGRYFFALLFFLPFIVPEKVKEIIGRKKAVKAPAEVTEGGNEPASMAEITGGGNEPAAPAEKDRVFRMLLSLMIIATTAHVVLFGLFL